VTLALKSTGEHVILCDDDDDDDDDDASTKSINAAFGHRHGFNNDSSDVMS